jgi:hypothetical protein
LAASEAGPPLQPPPPGLRQRLRLRLRDDGLRRFAFNRGPEPVEREGRTAPPAGVAWRSR